MKEEAEIRQEIDKMDCRKTDRTIQVFFPVDQRYVTDYHPASTEPQENRNKSN